MIRRALKLLVQHRPDQADDQLLRTAFNEDRADHLIGEHLCAGQGGASVQVDANTRQILREAPRCYELPRT